MLHFDAGELFLVVFTWGVIAPWAGAIPAASRHMALRVMVLLSTSRTTIQLPAGREFLSFLAS